MKCPSILVIPTCGILLAKKAITKIVFSVLAGISITDVSKNWIIEELYSDDS
jgi:hypothetical protein